MFDPLPSLVAHLLRPEPLPFLRFASIVHWSLLVVVVLLLRVLRLVHLIVPSLLLTVAEVVPSSSSLSSIPLLLLLLTVSSVGLVRLLRVVLLLMITLEIVVGHLSVKGREAGRWGLEGRENLQRIETKWSSRRAEGVIEFGKRRGWLGSRCC